MTPTLEKALAAVGADPGQFPPGFSEYLRKNFDTFQEFYRLSAVAIDRKKVSTIPSMFVLQLIRWNSQHHDGEVVRVGNEYARPFAKLFIALRPDAAPYFQFRG